MEDERYIKPPIGIYPEWLHKQMRYTDLLLAIERYTQASLPPDPEWSREASEIYEWLRRYNTIKNENIQRLNKETRK